VNPVKDTLFVRLPARVASVVQRHRFAFTGVLLVLALTIWSAVGVSAWFLHGIVTGLPDHESIRRVGTMDQATLLFDANDRPAFTVFREQRLEVPLSQVSPHVVGAIVAIEDQRFYEHTGIDLVRVAGAAVNNLREGRRAQGGSTLTQQLARQSFLTLDKTVRRKVQEMVVAVRLERQYTKDEILEMYLNKVYFGDGLHGIEAAALGYFGKHAAELDVAEAALLAGLVKSPSTWAPTIDPDRARARRDLVLRQMYASNAIDQAAFDTARQRPVELRDALRRQEAFGLYFKEEVRKQLVERFGWERVYQGGLRVYTTIDPDMQKVAEAQVARALDEIQNRRTSAVDEPLQAALVAMDARTGEVRALVGGRDFEQSTFNRATQARRQPGSAFKPFVYAAALERGYSPATLITDLDEPVVTPEGRWVPADERIENDQITMRSAIRVSSNRAAVRMLQQVGIPTAVDYAKRLGVGSVPRVPSLALGSGEVTLLSMTAAYSAFANQGQLASPTLIRRVEGDDGRVLYEWKPSPQRALSDTTAFLMTTMLADVVDRGTAWTARREGFRLPAAGKTGTTNDYFDSWFVGYTPSLVAGVWIGYDQPRTIIGNGYAAELAVPLWGRFMAAATKTAKPERFQAPRTITTARICLLSGKLARDGCRDAVSVNEEGEITRQSHEYTEYFAEGTEPTEYCELHGTVHTVATTGVLTEAPVARPSTPATLSPTRPAAPAREAERDERADRSNGDRESASGADREREEEQPQRRRGFWGRLFGR
jgi:1A family penicillin-binding protein